MKTSLNIVLAFITILSLNACKEAPEIPSKKDNQVSFIKTEGKKMIDD